MENNHPVEPKHDVAGSLLSKIRTRYFVVGIRRLAPWYAWLAIGSVAGIAAIFILLANQRGEIEPSSAALPAKKKPPALQILAEKLAPLRYQKPSTSLDLAYNSGILRVNDQGGLQFDALTYNAGIPSWSVERFVLARAAIDKIHFFAFPANGAFTRREGALDELAPGTKIFIQKNDLQSDIVAVSADPSAPSPSTLIVPANPAPIGKHAASDCEVTTGWTCDANDFSQALTVVHYADAPAGQGGAYLGRTKADVPAKAAVASSCGGTISHGFSFPVPSSLKTDTDRKIYAYAVDIGSGSKTLLGNSPQTFHCRASGSPPPPPPPPPAGGSPPPPTPPSATNKFSTGDRVSPTSFFFIRRDPFIGGPVVGIARVSDAGVVTNGPIRANGYTWWKVAWNSGANGWSVENWMKKNSAIAPPSGIR